MVIYLFVNFKHFLNAIVIEVLGYGGIIDAIVRRDDGAEFRISPRIVGGYIANGHRVENERLLEIAELF